MFFFPFYSFFYFRGSNPPGDKGEQRNIRLADNDIPLNTPYFFKANRLYSEQEG
jgi:hypothetical protein